MIHIVFNHSDQEVLKQAMELDESFEGKIIQVRDDYSVGPLEGIYSPEGMDSRKDWWSGVLAGGDFEGKLDKEKADDSQILEDLKVLLSDQPGEELWIWAAQNAHDVCGYYWLVSQLKEFEGRVFILYLNNLPFINEKGHLFYPEWLFQIPPREFLKARKLARPVTLSEFEIDPDEWKKLMEENGGIRLLEGGKKLVSKDYDEFDKELVKGITGDWQKAGKVIHHFLHRHPHATGDAFLLWRLKTLIPSGEFDVQGHLGGMKEFEIKKRSLQTAVTENE